MSLDGKFREQLRQQMSQENETIQTVTREQLDAMRSELKGIYSGALSTIEADMQSQSKALAKNMRSLILWPSLIWVGLLLTLSAGAWGVGQYQLKQIQEQRSTLRNLETLGVEPVQEQSGRGFLVLPQGATISEIRQTESGQPFVELMR